MNWWTNLQAAEQQMLLLAAAFAGGALIAALVAWALSAARLGRRDLRIATLESQLIAEARVAEERELAFQQTRQQLEASFSLLSGEALERNSRQFLELAEARLRNQQTESAAELGKREQAIANLVKPINESLDKTSEMINRMERERKQAFGSLEKHLELMNQDQRDLRNETRNLVQALRRPEVRGRWGEMTLKRLVEMAGMVEHCDFSEQIQVQGDDGRMRPDMVIRLPDEREIVVDVKTPLDAYLSAQEAPDEAGREQFMVQHVRNVRKRIQELAAKSYWEQFPNAPDFVVAFIPGEQFLAAAMDRDATLLEDALRAKVILATPTSLIALLKAVAFSWRQVALIRNAEEIRNLAEEFQKRVGTFSEHFSRVGKALASTVDHFNRTVGSLDRQVLPSARRLTELGVAARKEIVTPEPVDRQVRSDT